MFILDFWVRGFFKFFLIVKLKIYIYGGCGCVMLVLKDDYNIVLYL